MTATPRSGLSAASPTPLRVSRRPRAGGVRLNPSNVTLDGHRPCAHTREQLSFFRNHLHRNRGAHQGSWTWTTYLPVARPYLQLRSNAHPGCSKTKQWRAASVLLAHIGLTHKLGDFLSAGHHRGSHPHRTSTRHKRRSDSPVPPISGNGRTRCRQPAPGSSTQLEVLRRTSDAAVSYTCIAKDGAFGG